MAEIYLDHAAMTRPLPCALEAYRTAPFGNPSSEHAAGQRARDALEQAREKIAKLMDCESEEIYFTSTATEAAAMAINALQIAGYDVISSSVEHHSVSENAVGFCAKTYSATAKIAYAKMLYNNETGDKITPPFLNALWLCDATAAVGHVPVSFKELGCDYLIADALKFGGVPCAAFLIAKNGAPLTPLIRGGGQERGMRSGTENVPAICAMAAALEWQIKHMAENAAKLTKMQDFIQVQLNEIPNIKWNTPFDHPYLPHILNVSFMGVDAHALALILSKEGVMVSAGAACSNGKNEPSHVIMAMFGVEARARSAIRISLSHENTMEECSVAVEKIKNAVEYLRGVR